MKERMKMATLPRTGFIGRAIAIFGAATAAAGAIEGHRQPLDRDLYTLGINPSTFPTVRRGL